ncbi:Protein CBG18625 [Caenorhabditis briggsae]|uniref:Protein CBG18625 n=1 Tax=Caenorhabditis briggsae TaxID=6238 RepID=A8XTR1_CAEBR|nr:Protein CBG18625 [Caenorhabditis briggsae]CAP36037.2 Protein CBG18625 [Caenorhabditis briggsae]
MTRYLIRRRQLECLFSLRLSSNRSNRSAVYPINLHFYRLVFMFYGAFIFDLAFIVLFNIYYYSRSVRFPMSIDFKFCRHDPNMIQTLSILKSPHYIVALVGINLAYAHQTLLSLLAVQRFLLYFFPGLEPHISFGMKNTTKLIYAIHFLCFLPVIIFIIITLVQFTIGEAYPVNPEMEGYLNNITGFITNALMGFSAILYIPIYISIFRLRHLPSVEKNKPQNYIILQTILLYVFKIMEILLYLFLHHARVIDIMHGSFYHFQLDIYSTPLLVQIPYLFCNRRNVEEMRKRLSLKWFWSKVWNRKNSRVGGIDNSQTVISYIQSTHG